MAALLEKTELTRKDGTVTKVEDLKEMVFGFYFSAHWCPPCRLFTPQLKDFYETVNKDCKQFEVVFFSLDRDANGAKEYLEEAHGNWLYLLPEENIVETMSEKFSIEGIPALIVLKSDGTVITTDGRAAVSSKDPRVVIAEWKQ